MHHPPTLPGEFRAVSQLSGDGRLWRATRAGHDVVVRLFAPPRDPAEDPARALRMRHALWTLAQLDHPALLPVVDSGELADGTLWLAVPLVERPRLAAAGPLAPEAAARLLADLLGALDCLHRHGLVHGALDARRVRVAPDGAAILMDAGFTALALEARPRTPLGRPDTDPRGDMRAVGAMVLATLPDAPPTPDWLPRGVLPARADAVLRRLLATDPAAAFGSAREALGALGLAITGGDQPLPAAPLIGRAPEQARLALALAEVLAGRPGGLVWLSGPSGAGKSRLIDAFAHEVAAARLVFARGGAEVARGRGQDVPYGPLVRAVRSLLPQLRQHVPDVLARLAPVLSRLLPELTPDGLAPALEPPAARLRLQGALAELLAELARQKGLVLVIEGWERVDPLTGEALARLRRSARDAALMIVVAGTTERRPDWARDAEALHLGALPAAALGTLAAALLGVPEPPRDLAERLAAASGGLPRLAESALRGLVATGALRRSPDDGVWELIRGEVPFDLSDPLAGLPAEAAAIARAAAVLGSAADLDVLLAAAACSEDVLFRSLDLLRRGGLLVPGVDGSLGFVRAALAEHVLAGTPADQRRALHAAAAHAYRTRLGPAEPAAATLDTATAIARHALLADEAHLAAVFALEAGRRMASLHALADAEVLLEDGLACVRAEGRASWLGLRLDYLEALGDVRRIAGKLADSREAYLEAERLVDALGDRRRCGRILGSLAKVYQVLDDLAAAALACERSLSCAEATGDAGGQARALLTAARLRVYDGRMAEASTLAEGALACARASEDTARIAEALALLGYMAAQRPGTRAEGVERLQEAIGLLTGLGDSIGLNMAALMLGDAQAASGDLQAARKSFTLARWILSEVGVQTEAGITAINLGLVALELGEPEEAAACAAEARALAQQLGHGFQTALADGLAAVSAALRGQLAEALARAELAEAGAASLGNAYLDSLVCPLVLEARSRAGDFEGAHRCGAVARGDEAPAAMARRLGLLAEVWGRRGDLGRAALCAQAARVAAEEAEAPVEQARVRRVAAWIALRRGDVAGARRAALEARAQAERLGLRLQVAALEGLLGEAARRQGDADPEPHFRLMAELARDAGAGLIELEAMRALAELDPTGPAAAEAGRLAELVVTGLEPALRARLAGPWLQTSVPPGDGASHERNVSARPPG